MIMFKALGSKVTNLNLLKGKGRRSVITRTIMMILSILGLTSAIYLVIEKVGQRVTER